MASNNSPSSPNPSSNNSNSPNTSTNTPAPRPRPQSSLAAALAGSGASPLLPSSGSVASSGFRSVQFASSPSGGIGGDDASSRAIDDMDGDDERDPYDNGDGHWPPPHMRLRRRSSVGARLAALTDLGGVNSIRSFTRSFQRAANFAEVIPQRPSFVFAGDQEPVLGGGAGGAPSSYYSRSLFGDIEEGAVTGPSQSALRQQIEASSFAVTSSSENASDAEGSPARFGGGAAAAAATAGDNERKPLLDSELTRAFRSGSTSSIFAFPPHLAGAGSPIAGSYGSYRSYRSGGGRGGLAGSIDSAAGLSYGAMTQAASMAHAGALWRQQQERASDGVPSLLGEEGAAASGADMLPPPPAADTLADGERPAILVKEVEEDGKIILTVEGQSTLPQTIFNSINVLIGVGLLSLPTGVKYAGWIWGMAILFLAAAVTAYTARLLAKCMDLDPVVITFSDLAFISFGPRARLITSLLFTMELLAACVALIVLFSDSLDLLFPGVLSLVGWKVLCCTIMIPLNFLPMRLLSVTSIIGIVCCLSIVIIVVTDGFLKKTTPGSLIEPAATYLFPENWLTLPLSFGLLMSPWGGHSVFPNVYRDMRHPYRYPQAVKVTFTFTYILDAVTAVAGLLMFGDDVMDEITANILTTSGYPRVLTILLTIFIAIIPLTKIPLNARPIITTVEVLAGMHQPAAIADTPANHGSRSAYLRVLAKVAIRVVSIIVFLIISIAFPAFDSIMAFMGSALCYTICVTMSFQDKVIQYSILAVSIILSTVGTVWSFLPKSLLGIEG